LLARALHAEKLGVTVPTRAGCRQPPLRPADNAKLTDPLSSRWAALTLLLHTGVRTSTLLGTRRDAVHLASAVLTVAPDLQKGTADVKAAADPWACPLSPTAVAVCRALDADLGPDRLWLLPLVTTAEEPLYKAAAVHALKELQHTGALVLKGGHLVAHDLRRTWARTAMRRPP